MKLEIHKYEGAGNDFVIIDSRGRQVPDHKEFIAALCHRRFGIGADGVMILADDSQVDFAMRYFNADGSEATLCGNGSRCISLFARHCGIVEDDFAFRAVDGIHRARFVDIRGEAATVCVEMMPVGKIETLMDGWFLDTGSPHYVTLCPDVSKIDVPLLGRELRYMPQLEPYNGANINFMQIAGPDQIRLRTYERGVEDETLACGTGSVAAALTASMLNEGIDQVTVHAVGGDLSVNFRHLPDGGFDRITLTGPARRVFTGTIDTDNFGRRR